MWTRRLTVINGRTDPNDWMVLHNGTPVGRVYMERGDAGGGQWVWAVQIGRVGMGHIGTMEEALEMVRVRAR